MRKINSQEPDRIRMNIEELKAALEYAESTGVDRIEIVGEQTGMGQAIIVYGLRGFPWKKDKEGKDVTNYDNW